MARQRMTDYEALARASYGHNAKERTVKGYNILPELTTDDRVAYQNQNDGKVVIAFRGTDPTGFEYEGHNPWASGMPFLPGSGKEFIQTGLKSLWDSRAFRDVSTDIIMGLELEDFSSRFRKSEATTKRGIQKYGKENVTLVGHSLGGSQALEIGRKYDLETVAYNPYVGPQHLSKEYPKATIYHNVTDPVSIASPFVKAREVRLRYDTGRKPTIAQHGLVTPKTPTPAPSPMPPPYVQPTRFNTGTLASY
jgi:hypothetical protein